MRKLAAVMMVMMMCGSSGFAAFSRNDAGTSTAQFLKLGAGARAAALGDSMVAAADNADSIYWNPAGLNAVEGKSLSVMHAVWFEGIAYDWASYAQNIKNVGTVGIGVQYLSYGSIDGMDNAGLENGSFSPNDLAVSLSYARMFRRIGLGANVKYISSKITNTATAFAADLGAQCRVSEKLALGTAVRNAGTKMKFDSEEESLPMDVRLGGAYAVTPDWKTMLDVSAPVDNELTFGLGTEYRHRLGATMCATGRLGYNTRGKDTGGLNGVSAGVGFTYLNYTLDYAFVPYGDLGNTHRISFSLYYK